jgi:hypothetical protein
MNVRVRRRPAVAEKRSGSVWPEPRRRAIRRKAFSALFRHVRASPDAGLNALLAVEQQTGALDCFTLHIRNDGGPATGLNTFLWGLAG